jgi:hypothetical protein
MNKGGKNTSRDIGDIRHELTFHLHGGTNFLANSGRHTLGSHTTKSRSVWGSVGRSASYSEEGTCGSGNFHHLEFFRGV